MKTAEEIVKDICKINTYLLDEPEVKLIIELWQRDKNNINRLSQEEFYNNYFKK